MFRSLIDGIRRGIEYAGVVINHGMRAKSQDFPVADATSIIAFTSIASVSASQVFREVRRGEVKKACAWGAVATVSLAGATLGGIFPLAVTGTAVAAASIKHALPFAIRALSPLQQGEPPAVSAIYAGVACMDCWAAFLNFYIPWSVILEDALECKASGTYHKYKWLKPAMTCTQFANAFGPCGKDLCK